MQIRELHSAFNTDQPAAERKYLGKIVQAQGVSLYVGESRYGTPIIEVSDVADGIHIATFVLPYDDRRMQSFKRLKSVRLGTTVVVSGECRLYDKHDDYIVFKQCEILNG